MRSQGGGGDASHPAQTGGRADFAFARSRAHRGGDQAADPHHGSHQSGGIEQGVRAHSRWLPTCARSMRNRHPQCTALTWHGRSSPFYPVHPGGTSLQLLEAVGAALDQLEGDRRDRSPSGTGDGDVGRRARLYYVAPAAEAAVAHASVSMEWLHPNRQVRVSPVRHRHRAFHHQPSACVGRWRTHIHVSLQPARKPLLDG